MSDIAARTEEAADIALGSAMIPDPRDDLDWQRLRPPAEFGG